MYINYKYTPINEIQEDGCGYGGYEMKNPSRLGWDDVGCSRNVGLRQTD